MKLDNSKNNSSIKTEFNYFVAAMIKTEGGCLFANRYLYDYPQFLSQREIESIKDSFARQYHSTMSNVIITCLAQLSD